MCANINCSELDKWTNIFMLLLKYLFELDYMAIFV